MKYRQVLKMLEREGWVVVRITGSHMILRHPYKPGSVTLPGGGKLNQDIRPGTLNSVLKQAGIKP